MAKAIEMAKEFGIGMVYSNHFGMLAWVVQQALDADMMSLVFTNLSPAFPAWGGRSKLMGVSPIACGAPAGEEKPFILDMAPSIAARYTKLRVVGRRFLLIGPLMPMATERMIRARRWTVMLPMGCVVYYEAWFGDTPF